LAATVRFFANPQKNQAGLGSAWFKKCKVVHPAAVFLRADFGRITFSACIWFHNFDYQTKKKAKKERLWIVSIHSLFRGRV
jgi:hypothetical protein